MPKPYSILAAALVASGHSLSTATLAAPVKFHPVWSSGETEHWLLDTNREGAPRPRVRFSRSIRSCGAPLQGRRVVRIAPGYELGSKRIFPQAPIPRDARSRQTQRRDMRSKPWRD